MENSVEFKDRKGLITFLGIVQILLGVLSLLFFIVTMVSIIALPQSNIENTQTVDTSGILIGMMFYLVLAIVFIVLGIGSIVVKRWARTLSLLMSWYTVIAGVIVVIFMLAFFTDIINSSPEVEQITPGMMRAIQISLLSLFTLLLIIIPGLYILAYQSKNVTLTFKKYDVKERWTDKCPLPVLAISFSLLYTSILPLFYVSYGWVIPFFGIFITGIPALLILLLNSFVCIYLGIQMYKLNPIAWSYTIILYAVWIVSFSITLLFNNILDMYQLMNFPTRQLEMMERMNFLTNGNVFIFMFLFTIPWFIFLFYTKKYFRG